ncbi:MAG: hypothetical protein KGJ95_07470 [Candidatus Omnitrophica bacterium]|nr:hypothetical protein [Candidatus Omnitrophota bacterium]
MQTLTTCKGCLQNKPHHSKGYCRNCYHKFVVRGTGDFDRNDHGSYLKHLSSIKKKISATQKQRVKSAIISQLTEDRLKELYCEQKMSMGDIAKLHNCSRAYILLLLRKYGLAIRSKSAARGEAKKKGKNVGFSSINEAFFKQQTPEMAYVLGFIYSDGNLGNQLNQFSISQKEPEILYKIRDLMDSEHKITRQVKQELYTLTIGNKVMINDLLALGLTPNKSLDAKFPVLPNDLYRHFIRGYFDGDGSIFMSDNAWRVNFTSGSRHFLSDLEEALRTYAGCSQRPVYVSSLTKECKLVYLNKSDLEKLYNFLYDGLTVAKGILLNRKYDLFKERKSPWAKALTSCRK